MSTRVADRVDGWDERPFAGGYRGLGDLADADFSGVVRAGGADLYMTKGTVVGIEGGSIEDFEDADGTARTAPSPALPLLAVMQSRGDEVRARYYTEDTPISEVDSTLSDGGFTGYVELSENVLSGDYYLVYHRGRSMSVAFVGNSSRLVDGEEAFRTADDEVGIYEVRPAEVDAIDIPEPEPAATPDSESGSGSDRAAGAAGAAGAGAGASAADQNDTAPDTGEATTPEPDTGPADGAGSVADDAEEPADSAGGKTTTAEAPAERGARDEDGATADSPGETAPAEPGADRPQPGAREPESSADDSEPEPPERGAESSAGGTESRTDQPTPERRTSGERAAERVEREPAGETSGASGAASQDGDGGGATGRDRAPEPETPSPRAEADAPRGDERAESGGLDVGSGDTGVALETRSVPSLDPDRTTQTESAATDAGVASAGGAAATGQRGDDGDERRREVGPEPAHERSEERATEERERADEGHERAPAEPAAGQPDREAEPRDGGTGEAAAELRERLEEREEAVERLEAELDEETERREELEAELAEVREERDELAAEVQRLESELERVEEEFGVAAGASQRLTAAEALEGTDLFVRYRSKNETTLADAHDGQGSREDLTGNLRLEQHTQFDADEVAVDGKEYAAFIRERVEYQFVTWLVEELLFEVRDTGQTDGLSDLYDALPDVDRAELNGTVAVRYTEDGEEHRGQETFDIVLRDRMGNPLFLANLNDSREGATEGMMEGLITAAERVGTSKDSLAGAFLVTESFFEPEALETAAEATKDGLLSRDSRKSFVNLSRKRGYHLCLVEARNQNFHLAVPEL